MALFPCSVCGQRKPGKLAALYNAWFDGQQNRTAYRQRVCLECLQASFVELFKKELGRETDDHACLHCGGNANGNSDAVYCTLYLPKEEPREFALLFCGECSPVVKDAFKTGAEPLADRGVSVRGPSPTAPQWGSALGL